MKLRNIKTIISREYLTRVQKKSFLLITFLGPVFFAAIAVLPSIIMFMAEDKGKQIAVVDQSGIVMQKMESNTLRRLMSVASSTLIPTKPSSK